MSYGYREFDEFASSSHTITASSSPQLLKLLQDAEQNIHYFRKNVETIEDKLDMLNTTYDTPKLREEIIQLVADTAQLAKIANKPIQNLRLKTGDLVPSDLHQFERLTSNFSSAGIKYKQLQRLTQNLEKELLNEAKQTKQRSYSEYSDEAYNDNPFDDDSGKKLMNNDNEDNGYSDTRYNDNMVIQEELHHDTRLLEEREQHMRQLETDIVDINDIFRDLGTMVHEQGDMIDNIEANVEIAGTRVEQGNSQLGKAVKHKKCSRRLMCVIFIIVLVIVIALVLGILILLGVLKVFASK